MIWQVITIVSLSLIFGIIVLNICTIKIKAKDGMTNVDGLVGKTGICIKKINDIENGLVKISLNDWVATSTSVIEEHEKIIVTGVVGNKLVVEKINKEMF